MGETSFRVGLTASLLHALCYGAAIYTRSVSAAFAVLPSNPSWANPAAARRADFRPACPMR